MKYDLERLGPYGFQDVVSALAQKVLGAQVHRMGRGRDGGRDMVVEGTVVWGGVDGKPGEVWDGTTVFQAKHKATLTEPQKDAAWVWDEIRKELDVWSSPDSHRGPVPHYLVFATNVPLTPVQDSGGFDIVHGNIRRYLDALRDGHAEDHLNGPDRFRARREREARRDRMQRLRRWRIWEGNQIDGLLDAHEGVRRAFDGFLTVGDVLADLSFLSTSLSQDELGPALSEHARWALIEERNVYFDEAGGDTRGVPVEQVAIDLPVNLPRDESKVRIMQYVLDRGDHVLRPTVATLGRPRHLVVTGAPGNGKTTVSKFLVHSYRAALLGEETDLSEQHREAIDGTADRLKRMGRAVPSHRRWPFRVDLAEFAKRKATDSQYTLLNWVADSLSRQVASRNVARWALWSWLQAWPSFLVLDGLDEVTEPTVRKGLISDVEAFVADAEAKDCDMLVVVTTRPTGYAGELDARVFERVDLADLLLADALSYGRLVTRVRIPNDEYRRKGIEALLSQAANNEALRHLLRTPLQVLIMSIIAETSRQFAPSRFALFWRYYQVIEAREQTKPLGYSALLRNHAQQVLDLHRRVGLLLQQRAETAAGATAVISPADLRDVAWQVLSDAEYQPSTTDAALLNQILTAVTHRLVLLAPRGEEGYGFDVRSMQELMAALELTTGALDEVLPRLRRIAASPHWRNTLLFAAGRYFADPQPTQQEAITDLVLALDEDAAERLGELCPIGPELAWDFVDDGMTASIPKWLHRLVIHGLTMLHAPAPKDLTAFTRVLTRAATRSESVRGLIRDGLRDALGGTTAARTTAERVQDSVRNLSKDDKLSPDVIGLAGVRRDPSHSLLPDPVPNWTAFDEAMTGYADDSTREVLESVRQAIHEVASGDDRRTAVTPIRTALLDRPEVAEVLQIALSSIAAGAPDVVVFLRDNVLPGVWRRPVDVAAVGIPRSTSRT